MATEDLDQLIHTLIFADPLAERLKAQWEMRSCAPSDVLRPLFGELIRYFRELVRGERPLRDDNFTPFLQFQDVLHPIQYLLWFWHEDALWFQPEEKPLLETLMEMLEDSDRRIRALAMVCLGTGNVIWREARVESLLRPYQNDPDFLVRSAARLALLYITLSDHVEANVPPDPSLIRHLEQYAAQFISGLNAEKREEDSYDRHHS